MRLATGLPVDQLGPIGKILRGRCLHDVVIVPGGLLIRCMDGVELDVQFASSGAELRAMRTGVVTEAIALEPRFLYMRGKRLDCAYTHRELFLIVAADGHVLRCDWKERDAKPRAIDVQVPVDFAPAVHADTSPLR